MFVQILEFWGRANTQYQIKMTHDLLQIKPSEIPRPTKHGKTYYTKGDFSYFHYCCDNYNDVVSWLLANNMKLKLIFFNELNRDGVVPIVHCNRCPHGSWKIATKRWTSMQIMDWPSLVRHHRSKIFNKHWLTSMISPNHFSIPRTGLVH